MTFNFDREFQSMMQEHNLTTVILLGHLNPDGDAAGSVMGLAHYIKVNYPQYKVMPYLADTLDKAPKKQVSMDKAFNPFEKPDVEEKYGVIVCATAVLVRMIGREYYESAEASIVIDHHASNEGYGDVNYTKISEACAENVYYILDENKLKNTIDCEISPTAAGVRKRTNDVEKFKQEILERIIMMRKFSVQDK